MASQLNSYRNFIDIKTKEGQSLLANAIEKFTSPLAGDERIALIGPDFQKLKDNISRLGSLYGYDYLFKRCASTRVDTPAIPEDVAAGIAAVPASVSYTNPINMLERYTDGNVELAQKHASLIWGDRTFTVSATVIDPLTAANGFATGAGNLNAEGKKLVLKRMHSKFLGHQLLALLTDSARQAIEQQSSLYTWISASGEEEEIDGLTVLALILSRVRPNFKVDMYAEITKVKKLTIAQYDNDVQLYFDAVQFLKLHIDQKDPSAYTEDAYIRDLFLQLKHESLPAEFRLEFARQETRWMMSKKAITSQSLIDDASAYYVNLKNTGAWKVELSKNSQLIALTTQVSELENKLSKLNTASGSSKQNEQAPAQGNNKYVFELWRLSKVDNKAEHNMIERDGKTWYWCNDHRYKNKGVVSNGMYVTHKPQDHEQWRLNKEKGNRKKGKSNSAESTPAPVNDKPKPATVLNDSAASKLSLSKSLQAALVTTAGISESQFEKIWNDACNASGN